MQKLSSAIAILAIGLLAAAVSSDNTAQDSDASVAEVVEQALLDLAALDGLLLVPSELQQKQSGTSRTFSNDFVEVQILGKSGKVRFQPLSDINTPETSITITMDSLRELDVAGNVIGVSGKANAAKHSRNTFANTDFTFGSIQNVVDVNGTLIANTIDFTVSLVGSSTLRVTTILFRVNRTIDVGLTESFNVSAGSLKFNVQVDNWPFCSLGGTGDAQCSSGGVAEVGELLELGIEIKIEDKLNNNITETSALQYQLGNTVSFQLSSQVLYSAAGWDSMSEPYPTVSFTSNATTSEITASIKIAFDRFDSGSAFYDPLVSLLMPKAAAPSASPVPNNSRTSSRSRSRSRSSSVSRLPSRSRSVSRSPTPSPSPSRSFGAPACGTLAAGKSCTANSQCKSCSCNLSKKKCN